MKRSLITVGFLIGVGLMRGAEAPAQENVLAGTLQTFLQRVDAATKELSEARAAVARDKLPLVQASRELETKISALESAITRLETQQSQSEETKKGLLREIDASRKNLSYISTLGQESLKNFGDVLLPGELSSYTERIDAAQKGLENADPATNVAAALAAADLIMARLDNAVGGYSFHGKALSGTSHELLEGSFAFYGPESFFTSTDGGVVGTARIREGSQFPVVYPVTQWKREDAATFFKGQRSVAMLDSSGGKALQLKQAEGSVWQQVERGGVVAFVIIGVGVLAVVLAGMKMIELARLSVDHPRIVEEVVATLAERGPEAISKRIEQMKATTRGLFQTGLRHFEKPKELLEEHVFAYVLKQRLHFERRLPLLAVIATAAPLLGLLGTVTGMVKTFTLITVFGTGSATKLSSGISEALITTKLGLVVAIPALVAHGFLSHRLHKALSLLERYSFELVTASEEAKANERVSGKFP